MYLLNNNRSSRRAMTLIEIMVVVAITVVTLGVVMGIMTDTNRAIDRKQSELAMATYAQSISNEVSEVIGSAVAPSYLDGNTGSVPLVFTSSRCTLISARGIDQNANFLLWEIGNADGEVFLSTHVLDAARQTGKVRETAKRTVGVSSSRFKASVDFSYAASSTPMGPVFKSKFSSSNMPKLVRVHVVIKDSEEKIADYSIHTTIRLI